MFDHADGVKGTSGNMITHWKEELHLAVEFVQQKLFKYCAEHTPLNSILRISTYILNYVQKLWSWKKWDKGMDTHPDDNTAYNNQYQEEFPKYVKHEHCTKYRQLSVTKPKKIRSNKFFPSAIASGLGRSAFDPWDMSSHDAEYLMPNNEAEMAARQSVCSAH